MKRIETVCKFPAKTPRQVGQFLDVLEMHSEQNILPQSWCVFGSTSGSIQIGHFKSGSKLSMETYLYSLQIKWQ